VVAAHDPPSKVSGALGDQRRGAVSACVHHGPNGAVILTDGEEGYTIEGGAQVVARLAHLAAQAEQRWSVAEQHPHFVGEVVRICVGRCRIDHRTFAVKSGEMIAGIGDALKQFDLSLDAHQFALGAILNKAGSWISGIRTVWHRKSLIFEASGTSTDHETARAQRQGLPASSIARRRPLTPLVSDHGTPGMTCRPVSEGRVDHGAHCRTHPSRLTDRPTAQPTAIPTVDFRAENRAWSAPGRCRPARPS
jgi:hypothetical protein